MLLVAPAGYGKTTLAREWLRDRKHVWYQATPASSDVAALALGLADAAGVVAPTAPSHVRAHIKAAREPATATAMIATRLAAELEGWPRDTRFVIDDYHLLGRASQAESLIETLVTSTQIPFLIASRERPTWLTAKKLLYGEAREFGRTALAMTHEEAATALSHTHDDMPGLVSLAEGWPAVIGLAALVTEPLHAADEDVPETLHEFFAEELYQGLEPQLKWSLTQLSMAPSINERVMRLVFGDRVRVLLEDGYRCGFLTRGQHGYEMHPLLRQFLRTKIAEFESADVAATAELLARAYATCSLWDEAFRVADRFRLHDVALDVLQLALDSALSEGRVATVQRWVESARLYAPAAPVVRLAEIEVAFRAGDAVRAREDARELARQTQPADPLASRIYLRAGQISHLDDRLEEAVRLFTRAEESATGHADLRQALWSRFVSLTDLDDRNGAEVALEALERLPPLGVDDLLRASQARLQSALRWGGVDRAVDATTNTLELVSRSQDPVVRTGFLQTYGVALILAARYAEAAAIAQREIEEAQRFNLDWVLPHALEMLASAAVGQREFQNALKTLARVRRLAAGNAHTELNVDVLKARIHLCNGAPERSVQLLNGRAGAATSPGMHGDFLATLGIALICTKQLEEGCALLDTAESVTTHLEARTLSAFGRVIATYVANGGKAVDHQAFLGACVVAEETGNFDAFVTAYRACPALLKSVGAVDDRGEPFARIVRENDQALAETFGLERRRYARTSEKLTRREREVLELVSQGLSNRQIAKTLWIAESTVKVHIRHIFEKLGVASRTEAAVMAAEIL